MRERERFNFDNICLNGGFYCSSSAAELDTRILIFHLAGFSGGCTLKIFPSTTIIILFVGIFCRLVNLLFITYLRVFRCEL